MPWSVAAAAIGAYGAYAASENSKKGSMQGSQTSEPWWAQAQRLHQEVYPEASRLYRSGPLQYYPGQTVATQSPYTHQAIENLATQGRPESLTGQGQAQFGKTIAGDYLTLDSNPYLKSALSNTMNDIQGRVAGTFGTRGGNNYGSSAHQEWLGRNLMEAASPILNQNYQTERGRQLNAAQLAPQIGAAGATALGQAGAMNDAYQQALINADKARFDFQQNAPWDALAKYQGILSGNLGSSTVTNTPYFQANPYLNALGGGLAGYGAYKQFNPGGGTGGAGDTYTVYNPNYNSQGTFQPYYTGYDASGGSAYG
jgi:hypothetical protein